VGLRKIFVLGGARSGKSSFAERLAVECGEPVLYVATATATDAEMAERIARHRTQRPSTWRTLEAPTGIARRLASDAGAVGTVVVEDLTLLLSNLMASKPEGAENHAIGEVEAVLALDAHVIIVSNEVGMGVVPEYALGRHFRDALGRVNQASAAACGEVYLLVAGLPLRLK
jgi:adenosylcobinamide kinase / adenosylcobinamide-phosphate guanylyltransferase